LTYSFTAKFSNSFRVFSISNINFSSLSCNSPSSLLIPLLFTTLLNLFVVLYNTSPDTKLSNSSVNDLFLYFNCLMDFFEDDVDFNDVGFDFVYGAGLECWCFVWYFCDPFRESLLIFCGGMFVVWREYWEEFEWKMKIREKKNFFFLIWCSINVFC